MSPVSVGVASRRKFKKNADKPYPLAPVVAAIEAALAAPKSPDGRWPDEYNTAVAAMSSWLTSMPTLPEEPLTPFTLPLALALSSALGGVQPSTPFWLMQTPTAKVQEPFAVVTPSASQEGSQSVHARICFLPSRVT